jgi:hypothetical protein
VRWNANSYKKDPDTAVHKHGPRPKCEWLEYHDESFAARTVTSAA